MPNQSTSRILSVATAVPPYCVPQSQAKAFAKSLFEPEFKNFERLLCVFDNTQIQTRYLSQPPEWYGRPHTFMECNALYEREALNLSLSAAAKALARADVSPEQVGMVVFVSTTGLATPSLDVKLIQALGLSLHTRRVPVWGLGCAGGVAGLARAAELAQMIPGQVVLLVAVELCTLTFQYNDRSKANLIATSLFGDGAAAAVLQVGGSGPEVLNSFSTLFEDSEDVMGWDLVETGLQVRFARSIPTIIRRHLPELRAQACASWGISPAQLSHYVAHPGGAKVLTAYVDSLDLTPAHFRHAYEILQGYGNMSSCSVIFVLERFLSEQPPTGDYGVMLSLGPGFSAEQLLFRW